MRHNIHTSHFARKEEKGICGKPRCGEVCTVVEVCSYQRLVEQYNNFTRVALAAGFEFVVNLICPKIVKKVTTYRTVVPVEERLPVNTAAFGYGRFVYQPCQYL
jgi:hypothetical protein